MIDFNHRIREGDISEAVNAVIGAAILAEPQERRDYLGASSLGDPCARRLQYEYMNIPTDKPKFSARTYDIFAAGHFLEDLAIKRLRAAGFEVLTHDANKKQFGFSDAGGRIRGHVDGIILSAPIPMKTPAIFEHKGLKQSNWLKLRDGNLSRHFPKYASQLAQYQAHLDKQFPGVGYNAALFMCTNRDSMERRSHLIPPDTALAQTASDRGAYILKAVDAHELMPRVAASPDFFECKWCAWSKKCWETRS